MCHGCRTSRANGRAEARGGHALPSWEQVDGLIAQARRFKPILPLDREESTEWKDMSSDRWGGPPTGGGVRLAKAWTRGNCLKACIATILAADVERVPDPTGDFADPGDWLDRYDRRLSDATGYRLELLPAHACPPRNPNTLWIATIREDGPADHTVVARSNYVFHDPAGDYYGTLPNGRLVDGLLLVPAATPRTDRWGRRIAA